MTTDERNQECGEHSEGFKQCLKNAHQVVSEKIAEIDERYLPFKQCLNYQHCQGFVGCAKDANDKLVTGYRTKEGLCHHCTHWEELYEKRLSTDVISIRVNNRHYQTSIQSINKPPPKYAGFGGRKFVVKIKEPHISGYPHVFYTCDMWTQGTIPEYFREKLPDNAEFVNEVTETVVFDGIDFITCFDVKG